MDDSTNNEGSPSIAAPGSAHAHSRANPLKGPVILVAAIVAAGVALAGVALGHSTSSPSATISVTGSGTVQGTPDTMSFQIGVQTTASSALSALDQNNARLSALETTLFSHGVKKKDVQTSGLNIYENTNNAGVVTGFSVSDDLNVTMHGLKNAGSVIDAAAHAVGNGIQLYGVTFSISNQSSLLAAARAKAMANAFTEASQVANGGHATVGAIVKVTDQENTSSPPVFYGFAAATAAKSAGVPIQGGSQSVNVTVSVVYALHN